VGDGACLLDCIAVHFFSAGFLSSCLFWLLCKWQSSLMQVRPCFSHRLKNLSNVRFGRLNRRFDERRGKAILQVLRR